MFCKKKKTIGIDELLKDEFFIKMMDQIFSAARASNYPAEEINTPFARQVDEIRRVLKIGPYSEKKENIA